MTDKMTVHLADLCLLHHHPHLLMFLTQGEEMEEDSLVHASHSEVTAEACEEEDATENTTTDLPPFTDLVLPSFIWGDLDGSAFSARIN